MNNQLPPGAAIRIAYDCQRCGARVSGQTYRAPGKHTMGRVQMEQYVCKDCQTAHVDHLNGKFWGDMPKSPADCCGACPNKLERGQSMIVHRALKADGTWEMSRVCEDCFGEYKSHCAKIAEGNNKKK